MSQVSRKELKLIAIEKDTHSKLKLYSQVTGIKIYKIASEAIKEYLENRPVMVEQEDFRFLEEIKDNY